MSITDQPETEPELGLESQPGMPVPSGGRSLLDYFHAKQQELQHREPREELKIIPGWDGALAARFRYPEGGSDTIVKAMERAQRGDDTRSLFDANCDALIACCHEIVGRQPDGDWESLDPDDPRPVRFNHRLADLLQIELPDVKSPARFIVRHVYSPQAQTTGVFDGDLALMRHAGELVRWLTQADETANEALQGE